MKTLNLWKVFLKTIDIHIVPFKKKINTAIQVLYKTILMKNSSLFLQNVFFIVVKKDLILIQNIPFFSSDRWGWALVGLGSPCVAHLVCEMPRW